jgi:hypothetical protein
MRVRDFLIFSVMAACLSLAGVSCRRDQADSPAVQAPAAAASVGSLSSAAAAGADTNLLAAIVTRQQAERVWRTNDPQAVIAFKRLTEAEAAYTAAISQFGLYSIPAAERDAALNALADARQKGEKARAEAAEKTMTAASERAEQGAARLRSGNPSIQKAYDEWLEARKAYSALRDQDATISKAAETMTQLIEKQNPVENDRNDPAKEN